MMTWGISNILADGPFLKEPRRPATGKKFGIPLSLTNTGVSVTFCDGVKFNATKA